MLDPESEAPSELSEEELSRIYEDLITPPLPSSKEPRVKTSFYNLLVDEASAVEVYDEMKGIDRENLLRIADQIDTAEGSVQKPSAELDGVSLYKTLRKIC